MDIMKNQELRDYVLDLWNQYRITLRRYDTNGIFIKNKIGDGVTDSEINDFLQKIYPILPIPKRVFTLESDIIKQRNFFKFDSGDFVSEDYKKHQKYSFEYGSNETINRENPPLQVAHSRIIDKKDRKNKISSYQKLFGNDLISEKLGDLITAVHSTSISEGIGLENFIYEMYDGYKKKSTKLKDVLEIIKSNPEKNILFNRVIIPIRLFKENNVEWSRSGKNIHLDFLYYRDNFLYIRELKDTGELDTKKISVEINELHLISELLDKMIDIKNDESLVQWAITDYNNLLDKVRSIERKDILKDGKTFAELLGIDYNEVNELRLKHNLGNKEWFLTTINEILKLNEHKTTNETTV